MSVVTVSGMTGSGAIEIGAVVARKLSYDYVDRLILAEAARKIGTTVAVVADKTERSPTLRDRISSFIRAVVERSALAGEGADPYLGGGSDSLLIREYQDISDEGTADGEEVSDARLIEVTRGVMTELAQGGNVVIIGRGSNIILNDWPGSLHVGLNSSMEARILRTMERQQMERAKAEKYIHETDRGRTAYYRRFLHSKPNEALTYHLVLNTDWLDVDQAGDAIIQIVKGTERNLNVG